MTNTVDEMRAMILFDVIKESCGMDTILSTENLCRDFKIGDGSVVNALKNINIEIEKGKLTILRGRSGSGKTTLINILGALDKPTKGKVMFGGRDITRLSERARDDIRRYKMAFVFQSVALRTKLHNVHNFLEYSYIELSCNRVDIHSDILAVRIILLDSLFDT